MIWYGTILLFLEQVVPLWYPGPRGFLLFFLGKFCDANRLFYFFHWHKVLIAEGKSLWSRLLGSSLFDSCFWLEDIFIALRVIWLDGLNIFGDVIGQKKMTSLTTVKCWASMKVRFSTILPFLFSRLCTSISTSRCKFTNKKDNIKRKPLGPGSHSNEIYPRRSTHKWWVFAWVLSCCIIKWWEYSNLDE